MTTAAAIIEKLGETAGVTDLAADRIYSVTAPDGITSPHVVFQHIGTDPGVTHEGAAGANLEMFQFACFAASPTAARALRDAVVAALDGVDIASGDNPTLEDKRDDSDFDDATHMARADADFLI